MRFFEISEVHLLGAEEGQGPAANDFRDMAPRRNRSAAPYRSLRLRPDADLDQSPITEVQRTASAFGDAYNPGLTLDYEVVKTIRREGGTDHVAMLMVFRLEISCISWLTDRPGGFTDAEIAGLADIAEMLTVLVEPQTDQRIVRILMDTYVGHRTGESVLSGR